MGQELRCAICDKEPAGTGEIFCQVRKGIWACSQHEKELRASLILGTFEEQDKK